MPLLNYTTSINATKTVGEVTKILVRAGARQIATEYDDDEVPIGVAFVVETPEGRRRFALPANIEGVHAALRDQGVTKKYQTWEHAGRVAWRILKDWIEAQLAIIDAQMVRLDQVMLPYMLVGAGSHTVWDQYLDDQLALPKGES